MLPHIHIKPKRRRLSFIKRQPCHLWVKLGRIIWQSQPQQQTRLQAQIFLKGWDKSAEQRRWHRSARSSRGGTARFHLSDWLQLCLQIWKLIFCSIFFSSLKEQSADFTRSKVSSPIRACKTFLCVVVWPRGKKCLEKTTAAYLWKMKIIVYNDAFDHIFKFFFLLRYNLKSCLFTKKCLWSRENEKWESFRCFHVHFFSASEQKIRPTIIKQIQTGACNFAGDKN